MTVVRFCETWVNSRAIGCSMAADAWKICHMSGVPWLIITGSGLDDWIYYHFFTITLNYNQWLPKTRSTPYWTTSVFSSTVSDLVLIYESVTSSASVVHWTLHSWALNSITNDGSLANELWALLRRNGRTLESITCPPFITLRRTEYRSPSQTVSLLFFVYPFLRNVRQFRSNALISTSVSVAADKRFSEPFSSNGLFRLSGVMSQYATVITIFYYEIISSNMVTAWTVFMQGW
jgi:hypothetical protein